MRTPLTAIAAIAAIAALSACSSTTPNAGAPAASPATSTSASASAPAAASATQGTPIIITAGDQTFTATLNDSQVAEDFKKMLPVTLPWFRNAGIEYITELAAPLTETGPFYTDVQPGDLVYYNPRDSITIIYAETSSVPTLTKLGEITSSELDAFRDLPPNIAMRIEAG